MPARTRGSNALDKAQRRLGQVKSIDENLDLGHGLTVEAYNQLIDKTRATLEAHNTLVSNLEESRKAITQLDKALSDFSARMLSSIGSVYGKDSIEYAKAGGSSRKRGKSSTSTTTATSMTTIEGTKRLGSGG
jgi:hypothetical protein